MSCPPLSRRSLIAGLCFVSVLTASCGLEPADTPVRSRRHVLVDFTDGEPVGWKRMSTFFVDVPIYTWPSTAGGSTAEGPWTVRDAETELLADDASTVCEDGLLIRPTSIYPRLWRDVPPFEASEANLLKVEASFSKSSTMRFFWSAAGQPFSPDAVLYKKATASPAADETLTRHTHLFKLDHPSWQGAIGRLRIDPSQTHTEPTCLHRFSLERRQVDRAALETHLDRAAMQDFSGDARLALPAPPGHSLSREVGLLPPGALFRSGFGLQQALGEAVTFTVSAELVDGTPIVLFERALDPARDHGRWHDVEIDLSPLAGTSPRLILSTSGPSWESLVDGVPVWGRPHVSAPLNEPLPPNVVFVVADTLRADRTSLNGYAKPTTPNLDTWAQADAVVFDNTVAAAPWTLPAHTSMLTGLDPLHHGANHGSGPWEDLTLLPEILRRHGYTTTAWTGGAYLTPTFGMAQGFQRLVYHREDGTSDLDRHLPAALGFLQSEPVEPFFLFFHTYETHAPYTARSPWLEMLSPELDGASRELSTRPGQPLESNGWRYDSSLAAGKGVHRRPAEPEDAAYLDALYDSSVARMDAAVGRLIRRIRDLGLAEDTLIVFTSDHGEALGERGRHGHHALFDEQIKIPLAISVPGRSGGRHVAAQVRQIDITPTLLDALGLPPTRYADGRSLLPFWDRNHVAGFPDTALSYAASSNHGLSLRTDNRRKTLLETAPWPHATPRRQVFDLITDPEELDGLISRDLISQDLISRDPVSRDPISRDQVGESLADEDLDRLALLSRLYASSCHWRLVASGGSGPAIRAVFGGAVTAYTFENPRPECPECLSVEEGKVVLKIPPNRDLTAFLPPRSEGDVYLDLDATDSDPLRISIPAERFDDSEPFGWILRDGHWQESTGLRDPSVAGLWLARQIESCPWMAGAGTAPASAASGSMDDETARRLKALGYRP